MIQVFLGYDPNETVAYHVLAHSIMRHAKAPVSITPLVLRQLPMTRKRDPKQSTEFSFSRFLVPHLCEYQGYAIFMDCDMLCREDITTLLFDQDAAVSVVKHNYAPDPSNKFLDQKQTIYAKKNWSSVMVFNNAKCSALTPEYVNKASGLELHQFKWTWEEDIGSIDKRWNCLISEENQCPIAEAKMLHFSRGGPWFAKFRHCDGAQEWRDELAMMNYRNGYGEYSIPDKAAA